MSAHTAWAQEDASLFELAAAFLKEKQYVMLVRNQEGEFSGLVTIADLMKHLLGVVK
jgi:CBS domain containing-hemolysin-like protein